MAPILAEGAAPAEDSEEFPEPSFSERPFPFPFPLFPLPLPLISSSYLFLLSLPPAHRLPPVPFRCDSTTVSARTQLRHSRDTFTALRE